MAPMARAQWLAFDKFCWECEIGKIEGPVKTEYGYHLVYVHDRKTDEDYKTRSNSESANSNVNNYIFRTDSSHSNLTFVFTINAHY